VGRCGGRVFFFVRGGFLFVGGGFWFGAVFGGGFLGRFLALEFEEEFIAEAEALLPGFELVAGLLGGFFVLAEIEN